MFGAKDVVLKDSRPKLGTEPAFQIEYKEQIKMTLTRNMPLVAPYSEEQ
jgi:hypothetical protein